MNAQQRKYLIDKITEKTKLRLKALGSEIKQKPPLSQFLLHLILSDKFELRSVESIREVLKEKAGKLISEGNPKGNKKFLDTDSNWGGPSYDVITLLVEELFVLPKEYEDLIQNVNNHNDEIRSQISALRLQSEGLETRIMLASDKTLQRMVNEVDDMGDISLLDTKIKLIE